MPGNALAATADVDRIEAPVTWKAYLICAFASFGGIFFGYDSGYINGVLNSQVFIDIIRGPGFKALEGPTQSLIVSILSAGTFFGAIIAGDIADMIGRKWTVIIGCVIYIIGMSRASMSCCLETQFANRSQVSSSRLLPTVSVSSSQVVSSPVSVWVLSLPLSFCICPKFAQRKSVARSSLATNSVSR
jgi:MFS family permease